MWGGGITIYKLSIFGMVSDRPDRLACCGPLGPPGSHYCIQWQYIQGAWDITATCGEYVLKGKYISTLVVLPVALLSGPFNLTILIICF